MPECSENTLALLRLSMTPGLGPRRIAALIELFGSAMSALAARPADLERVPGIGAVTGARIAKGLRESARLADDELRSATKGGVHLVGLGDAEYPPLLRQIPDPPPVLYVMGGLLPDADDRYPVGIVGSRRCTAYGIEQAERFGSVLSGSGLTVVSGGARGIDSGAHRGALKAGGRTVAVLGCGLSHQYPPENKGLFDQIVSGRGALVSELPMDTHPSPENFPGRNRIISGLSLGVVVVEAAKGSGALITARAAGEDHGRDVFVVPGRVDSPASEGSLGLLRAGGGLIALAPGDVIAGLETPARHVYHETHSARYVGSSKPVPDHEEGPIGHEVGTDRVKKDGLGKGGLGDPGSRGSGLDGRVLDALGKSQTIESLVEVLDADAGAIRTAVTMLEIRGMVRRRGVLLERTR